MKLNSKNILVTGGAGFIGSHLVESLLERGNRVIAFDCFDDYYKGKERNIQNCLANPNFKLVKGDILDYDTLLAAVKDVDVVFHLAAQPGVRFSLQNPWKTTRVNVYGTSNVLLATEKSRVEKVVFASSSSVYGAPQYLPCDEKHPTKPISPYGTSKLAAEIYCNAFLRIFSLPITILRYHTVYGPRQRPDMAIHKFTNSLIHGLAPKIYGDGNQTRDFTFVLDAVEGTILAAESEESNGEAFNIGSGTRVVINDVLALLKRELDKEDICQTYLSSQTGDAPDTQADITKARHMLGYNPKFSFEQGVKLFLSWYINKEKETWMI